MIGVVHRYELLVSQGLAPKCVIDHTWDTTQVRNVVKNTIEQNAYIGRCLARISASWRDVRLCDPMSRGGCRRRVMSPRLDVGNITLADLLM
jgi:hypothetical protein